MALVAPDAQHHDLPSVAGMPQARGPLTERLFASLCKRPHDLTWNVGSPQISDEDDFHLALYCCYELHYQGFSGVDADWEWEPSLLAIRRRLERNFLGDLHARVGPLQADPLTVVAQLREMAANGGGPSLSSWVATEATIDQLRELAVHRSAYQLKEADPHTWGIPRLAGQAKAAMVAIQADEYGGGVSTRMHATLFGQTMAALGLDSKLNSYVDLIPGVTLATTNLISMIGLHRRWRGALAGHLALFEMTSVEPMAHYAYALRRLGVAEAGCRFYDVHVDADQTHQNVGEDMITGLLGQEPELAHDVIFGAAALKAVEARFSGYVLDRWRARGSSLRSPLSMPDRPAPPP